MDLTHSKIARRLLGTATQLFIDDLDPVSVHCLACSAAEHASQMSYANSGRTFNNLVLDTHPNKTLKDIRKLRNRDWNAIKHARDQKGQIVDPKEILSGFDDRVNDATLFVVWYDYARGGEPLPIEAQIFQVWYFELYPEKLEATVIANDGITTEFPNLPNLRRQEQKRLLREKITQFRQNLELLSHPMTDERPLVLD